MIIVKLIITLMILSSVIILVWVNTEAKWLSVMSEKARSELKDYSYILLLTAFIIGLIIEGV